MYLGHLGFFFLASSNTVDTSCVFLWVTTSRSRGAFAISSEVAASSMAASWGNRLTASYLLTCTYVCLGTKSNFTVGGGVPRSPTILTRVGTSLGNSWSDRWFRTPYSSRSTGLLSSRLSGNTVCTFAVKPPGHITHNTSIISSMLCRHVRSVVAILNHFYSAAVVRENLSPAKANETKQN